MNLLFVKLDKSYLSELSKLLIPAGIEFKSINTYLDAVQLIQKDRFSLILQDIDFNSELKDDISSDKLIKYIKNKYDNCSNVVILTGSKDDSYLTDYVFDGIMGIIYKTDQIYDLAKQFCFILKSIPDYKSGNSRKFVRVKPDSEENAYINIILPLKNASYQTRISDLSIKGVAFNLENQNMAYLFQDGDIFENIELLINNRVLLINGQIIIRGKIALLMFKNVSEYSEKLLCKYVADKIVSVK